MNNMHTRVLVRLVMVAVFSAGIEAATAETFSFFNITNNNAGDAAIGEAQLFVDVTDPGPGQVLFTFYNIGPEDSSITDVFFDDGALLGIAEIDDSHPGVSFSIQATPNDLPGGNNADPPFETTQGFSADSDAPVAPNGVDPGEWLGITFDLLPGMTFSDLLFDLGNESLRIGIHVQSFASGGSESFINLPGCANDGNCDDGLFCNGIETCNAGTCLPGDDPCPGQEC
ncbi:MAG: hypothetical protein IID36_13675, partial [Planctomycetes bacterium]|nr:hypothetical protein [Planctomycetota bacterium]